MSDGWVSELQQQLEEFANERQWSKYHSLRNLAALISSEAGELLALYRWDQDALRDNRVSVEHELADVFLAVIRFAAIADIDLYGVSLDKIALNALKYPVDATHGPDVRYNHASEI